MYLLCTHSFRCIQLLGKVLRGSSQQSREILPAEITPTANQLELHLYNPQLNLLAYLKSEAIVAQAYPPWDQPIPRCSRMTLRRNREEALAPDIGRAPGYLLAEEDLQMLDGVAVGGKQKRLIMADCGIGFGSEDWP
ncbi:hypothetical protein FIBSPDRAFT_324212 [Athelia psychrophila]|uniref:Uncharacterized protein n=1 Tax=Athelia psychrophila TaxID=1759441 RepID=A0A167WNV0_9AGAM|nr:hypothetical protein FIBSPDRAFT_324212 [Fibularhizoctonia sp. CBS 109695]